MPPRSNTPAEFVEMKDQCLLYLLCAQVGFAEVVSFAGIIF